MTELDLRHSLVPDEVIDELLKTMPEHKGPNLQQDRGVPQYDYVTFMEKFIEDGNRQKSYANGNGVH